MKKHGASPTTLLSLAGMLLSPLLCVGANTFAARCVAQESGVQVLTRGPVHEAFASASMSGSVAGEVIGRTPYESITEVPPDQRPVGDDVAWIPGYWSWDEDRSDFIWVSGVWRDLPPGRQWVPGYWASATGGSQWISGFWGDAVQSEVTYLPPPPEPLEAGPSSPSPGPNTAWAPGCWIWQQSRYDWQPGYWVAPAVDWVWSPAHYTWTPRGYIYVPGYWDHDLGHRGVIFAPVYYERPIYTRPNYYYSPAIVIDIAVIAAFMFVQPRSHHYYFGDYYDQRYEERGYYPWYSRHGSHYGDDPLYIQYRSEQLRNDRDWDIHVDELYHHRRDHAESRPPQTLAIQINRATQGRSDRSEHVTIGRSLTEAMDSPTRSSRFAPVSSDERAGFETRGRDVRKLQVERANMERPSGPSERGAEGNGKAEPARIRLPQSSVAARSADKGGRSKVPPPDPALPRPNATETRIPAANDRGPAREAGPAPDNSPDPRKVDTRGPRVDKPRVDSKTPEPPKARAPKGTVAPQRESGRAPSAKAGGRPPQQAPRAKSATPGEKHQQLAPQRSTPRKSVNPSSKARK
jgi:hypothetical protein